MKSSNGASQNNVEDILASIRTSISDETSPFRPGAAVPLRRDAVAEEAAEFELPAIFKPGHQPTAAKGNLFGRLSDALKPTPEPEPDRSRTVIRFEPASGPRAAEAPRAQRAQPQFTSQPSFQRAQGPVQDAAPHMEDVTAGVLQANADVKREMTSFFDTRMQQMAAPPPRPEPEPPAAPEPAPGAWPSMPLPPRLPETGMGGAAEDAAAQLLRPMLKEWLSENMPKIVERALRNEAPPDPSDNPRKTLR